ncbi:hypothetical protein ACWGLF_28685 [Streptomyces puniciscabiei]
MEESLDRGGPAFMGTFARRTRRGPYARLLLGVALMVNGGR